MTGPRPRSRTSHTTRQESPTSRSNSNAALLGATTAFHSRPVLPVARSPALSPRPYGATSSLAGYASRAMSPSPSHASTQASADQASVEQRPVGSIRRNVPREGTTLDFGNMPKLATPQQNRPPLTKSPSQLAAATAVSRAPPSHASTQKGPDSSTRPAIRPKPLRLSQQFEAGNDAVKDKPTDTTPIAPTTSLVNLFEEKLRDMASTPGKKPGPIIVKPTTAVSIQSPKPFKPGEGITSMFQMELEDGGKSAVSTTSAANARGPEPITEQSRQSSADSFASASEDLDEPSPLIKDPVKGSPSPSSPSLVRPGIDREATIRPPKHPSPLSYSQPMEIKQPVRSASFQSDVQSTSAQSVRSIPAQFNQAWPRKMTPLTTGDQLANALVASSLASSRAPSPRKMEPPPPPSRRKKGHHHGLSLARTPSPAKTGMLHTLRGKESSDSESGTSLHPYGKHRKKRHLRKHPNKHHEGDRKRWRDAVSERERKRYEGVWAANKGQCSAFTLEEERLFQQQPTHSSTLEAKAAVQEQVSNIVARDIWSRSRLPDYVLEVIWDLVDHDGVGRLKKDEFVVGMWLIDQRLKGRKLPMKVSETVWASVRGLQGIKIRK